MEQLIQSMYFDYMLSFCSFLWVLCFGFIMNVFVVLVVTRLSMKSAMVMTYKSHIFNTFIAALGGSLIMFGVSFFKKSFFGCLDSNIVYLNLNLIGFVSIILTLFILTSRFFCASFATVSCSVLERWLLVVHVITATIGYFVIKALGLFA